MAVSLADPTKSATATLDAAHRAGYGQHADAYAASAGSHVIGTAQTLLATLKDSKGLPISGASVTFQVAGANPASGAAATNAAGAAAFTYTGANRGTDTGASQLGRHRLQYRQHLLAAASQPDFNPRSSASSS